ncbi:MAG: 50S ribosomal protein L3 [Candidatus Harrisonbacteria bacterium]|nr:50S ribosomal protein L3 [Candidatus Harrisonbacteria bacterium]
MSMKILATKLKMTQIWKGDIVVPVSPLKIQDGAQLDSFKEGDQVKISGIVKGRGFQGVVKRWSFAGGPKTHGQKNRYRAPGSIGNTSPQRVLPGRKMAGHMGAVKKTIRNLKIVMVDKDQSLLMVKGSVPGNINGKITISK